MKLQLLNQEYAQKFLNQFINNNPKGRTIIIHGSPGVGKFSLAVNLCEQLLGDNAFLNSDFQFYRVDNYHLKTKYFMDKYLEITDKSIIYNYLCVFLARISKAYSYGELPKDEKNTIQNITVRFYDTTLSIEEKLKLIFDGYKDYLLKCAEELSKKQTISIDFIRDMIQFHSLHPNNLKRVTLIGNFENCGIEAQNAALKILEEPPQTSFIVLTVSDLSRILPTILSRALLIRMNPLHKSQLKQIFGMDISSDLQSTVDFMEESLYHYRKNIKLIVDNLFKAIIPNMQKKSSFFDVIQTLTADKSDQNVILFLLELLEYFRDLFFQKQSIVRGIKILEKRYEIPESFVMKVGQNEISEWHQRITDIYKKIKFNNINPDNALPALFIELGRWYIKKLNK